jgi:hypothetical protein
MLLAGPGCKGKDRPVPTAGTVYLDGNALAGAVVDFRPDGPGGRQAHGQSDDRGNFRMNTDGQDGALPGAYRVLVFKFDTSPGAKVKRSVLPSVYGSSDTPLRCTVPHDGPVKLELFTAPSAR